MNKNYNKSSNFTYLHSTSEETKTKFDKLLKSALNQKKGKPKSADFINRKECNNEKSVEATTHSEHTNTENENYILKKFLFDATHIQQDEKILNPTQSFDSNIPKQPVPLPRKIITNFSKPEITAYNISSPKITNETILKQFDKASIECNRKKLPDEIKSITSSQKTYTISPKTEKSSRKNVKSAPVGDVIIHERNNKNVIEIFREERNKKIVSSKNISISSTEESIPQSSHTFKQLVAPQVTPVQTIQNNETISNYSELKDYSTTIKSKLTYIDKSLESKDDDDEMSKEQNFRTYNYDDFIGVVIYKSDKLIMNPCINNPCVKVYIIDAKTGENLKRSKEISEQNSNVHMKHVYPLITKAYNLQAKRSFIPYWEELLIFEEDFDYIINYKNTAIIFFEILDFLSYSEASARYQKEGSVSGWYKIAWAFLKPVGKGGKLNTEEKLRLQLYKPKKIQIKNDCKECVLYDWWLSENLIKYPSSLHICIKRVKKPNTQINTKSELLLKEKQCAIEQNLQTEAEVDKIIEEENKSLFKQRIKWTRKNAQSCKIPNKILAQLKSSEKGCFLLKFSNNGLIIACACANNSKYPIILHSVLGNNTYCKFNGHQGLVYDFFWSPDDKYLLSASADCTVCIWNVLNKNYHPKNVLPHPSFVYCVLFKSNFGTEIITGCYDKALRVWKSVENNFESHFELKQELEGHDGFVTTICSRDDENYVYSGDSSGTIVEWLVDEVDWTSKRQFKFKELKNTIINQIILHPVYERLLIFTRDSTIRMIDLTIGVILQWYKGALNYRYLFNGCITPCGTYIYAPSEDGNICIWNADTGILQATCNPYSIKSSSSPIISYCVQYHPFDHIIATCTYGVKLPILLCHYTSHSTGEDIQLKNCAKIVSENIENEIKCKTKVESNDDKLKTDKNGADFDTIIEKIDEVLISAKDT